MTEHDDLLRGLPSRNRDVLARAIGSPLRDVIRALWRSRVPFGDDGAFDPRDEFRYASGATSVCFDAINHDLTAWSSELSIVVLPPITDAARALADEYRAVRLSESGDPLAQWLGLRCEDVWIWTYDDGADSDRACECAISYCLGGGAELVYGTYLHGAGDDDYVLPGHRIWRDRARACWSVARDAPLTFAEYSRG